MPGRARRVTLGLIVGIALSAPTSSMAASRGPTVSGSVAGTLEKGTRATFTITATHPEGWRSMDHLVVVLGLKGISLEELTFDVDDQAISSGGAPALLGTGNQVTGRFFRISALDVSLTTGGNRVSVTLRPGIVAEVPQGARFEFIAQDDFGDSVSVDRVATTPPEDGGLPIGTVAIAVVVALLAGGFVGSRVTSHRGPPPRSIYATVQRRIREDQPGSPSARPPTGR